MMSTELADVKNLVSELTRYLPMSPQASRDTLMVGKAVIGLSNRIDKLEELVGEMGVELRVANKKLQTSR